MMLTLTLATRIAAVAHDTADARNIAPLCVTVLDTGGHVLVTQRHEKAGLMRQAIAHAKAMGCLGLGFGGRELARRASAMPAFYAALTVISDGGFASVPGGVLIRGADGVLLGAVGVSGDTSDNDELCAVTGVESAGLTAEL